MVQSNRKVWDAEKCYQEKKFPDVSGLHQNVQNKSEKKLGCENTTESRPNSS